ncbi:MAG: 4-oxalomesaconate tautomerase [Pseudomonadota bacterium]
MMQTAIPFLFLRGGTSRGPYMRRDALPEDRETLSEVLIAALGAGHPLNIDGIGGGAPVTTKVAMLSRSAEPEIDIDYLFAQVSVTERLVDYKPTCGNILSGVGPASIEMGLVPVADDTTCVTIRAVNTGARVEARVDTPGGVVRYDGPAAIDGVPGTAAPVHLDFFDVAGSGTGAMLPTGQAREEIQGVPVTCIDVAMPVVVALATDLGRTGHETREALDADTELLHRLEAIRREAGERMGMGDVSKSVTPKIAMVAPAKDGGHFAARYFTPWACHPSLAVTGAQCLAACALTPGSVADGLFAPPGSPADLEIEHPMGRIPVRLGFARTNRTLTVQSAGLLRTARLLARGELYVPRAVWAGPTPAGSESA